MLCVRGDKHEADYQVTLYAGEYPSMVALCESCYEWLRPNMVMVGERRIERPAELILPLSTEDWQRILRRYALPTDMADLWVFARYERQGAILFAGIYVAGAYRLLFLDTEQLIWLDAVQDDTFMRICCAQMAREAGATPVA